MKIPPARYPSPLGRMQATSMDVEAAKRQGWREQHILVISDQDERLDFMERQLVRSIGERLYGDRRPGQRSAQNRGGSHG